MRSVAPGELEQLNLTFQVYLNDRLDVFECMFGLVEALEDEILFFQHRF